MNVAKALFEFKFTSRAFKGSVIKEILFDFNRINNNLFPEFVLFKNKKVKVQYIHQIIHQNSPKQNGNKKIRQCFSIVLKVLRCNNRTYRNGNNTRREKSNAYYPKF